MVHVDIVRYWKPDRSRPIDFSDVRDFIISIKRAGFNIKLVTFDRWQSDGIMRDLNSVGIKADKLSVDRDQYSELALLMGQHLIQGPDVKLLRDELKKLVVMPNGKIDHTNKSSKGLSDAVAGAVWNASSLTPRESGDLEVVSYEDIIKQNREAEAQEPQNLIRAPKQNMPKDIADWLDGLKML